MLCVETCKNSPNIDDTVHFKVQTLGMESELLALTYDIIKASFYCKANFVVLNIKNNFNQNEPLSTGNLCLLYIIGN